MYQSKTFWSREAEAHHDFTFFSPFLVRCPLRSKVLSDEYACYEQCNAKCKSISCCQRAGSLETCTLPPVHITTHTSHRVLWKVYVIAVCDTYKHADRLQPPASIISLLVGPGDPAETCPVRATPVPAHFLPLLCRLVQQIGRGVIREFLL